MTNDMVSIDGSIGEGGGQIFRSALSLSMVTGRPVQIRNIRAGRPKPGLLRQHLTALEAATRVCHARVDGAELGSTDVRFYPQAPQPGVYELAIGTAGSTTLVLQTILPSLMLAESESTVELTGGTHNPWAPPFEFLAACFARCVERMGPSLSFTLHRPGFHPAGGGQLSARVKPVPDGALSPLSLFERGALVGIRAEAIVAHLPETIAERELQVIRRRLRIPDSDATIRRLDGSRAPGNCVLIYLEFEHVTEVVSTIGRKGLGSETVASRAVDAALVYRDSGVPVGEFLADQLLLPGALAGAGGFRTGRLSSHAETNVEVIRRFLETSIRVTARGADTEIHFGA